MAENDVKPEDDIFVIVDMSLEAVIERGGWAKVYEEERQRALRKMREARASTTTGEQP